MGCLHLCIHRMVGAHVAIRAARIVLVVGILQEGQRLGVGHDTKRT